MCERHGRCEWAKGRRAETNVTAASVRWRSFVLEAVALWRASQITTQAKDGSKAGLSSPAAAHAAPAITARGASKRPRQRSAAAVAPSRMQAERQVSQKIVGIQRSVERAGPEEARDPSRAESRQFSCDPKNEPDREEVYGYVRQQDDCQGCGGLAAEDAK